MTFNQYLITNNISLREAAIALGLPYEYVRRYARGIVKPNEENMKKITVYTDGKVTANDFYGVEDGIKTNS